MIELPEHIQTLSPYKPGKSIEVVQRELGLEQLIKLASNENPFGPSPKAVARMAEFAGSLHTYPNGGATLSAALADRHQVHTDNVICGSGSESILSIALRAVLGCGDELLTCDGTFVGFKVQAQACGNKVNYLPLTADFRFDVQALAAGLGPRVKVVYIANPNNPTGTYITRDEFEWLHARIPGNVLIILDEAYLEYARDVEPDSYPDSLLYRFDNVLTLRTFSKAYGIAGLRVGYGIAHQAIIDAMRKVKFPFEPSTVAQSAALGALDDKEFLQQTVSTNTAALHLFRQEVPAMGISMPYSLGNFVMFDCKTTNAALKLYDALLRLGFITRPLGGFGLPHCLRVSTALPEDNRRFVAALGESVHVVVDQE